MFQSTKQRLPRSRTCIFLTPTRMKRLSAPLLSLGIACALLVLLTAGTETASADVSGSKTVRWRVLAKDGVAGINGTYTLTAKTKASGTHGIQPWKTQTKAGTWVGALPLTINDINFDSNDPDHARAWSFTDITVPAATIVSSPTQNPPRIEVEPVINVYGDKWVASPHEGNATGKHNGKAGYAIRGAKAQGFDLTGNINNLRIRGRGRGRPMVAINEQGHSLHDPVTITLIDTDTGIEHLEELFALDIYSQNGEGTAVLWDYDWETGISLSVGRNPSGMIDGSVSIGGVADSAWLVNPAGSFGASLGNGVFTPTGAWAGLPWSLTFDGGDVVGATLAPEHLPSILDYVIPDSFLDPASEYEQILTVPAQVIGAVVVPEPASLTLLLLGGLMLARRRRR